MNTYTQTNTTIDELHARAQLEIDRIVSECGRVFVYDAHESPSHDALLDPEMTTYGVLVHAGTVDDVRIMERRNTPRPLLTDADIARMRSNVDALISNVRSYGERLLAWGRSVMAELVLEYEAYVREQEVRRRERIAKREAKRAARTAAQRAEEELQALRVLPTVLVTRTGQVTPVHESVTPSAGEISLARYVVRAVMRDLCNFSTPIDKR